MSYRDELLQKAYNEEARQAQMKADAQKLAAGNAVPDRPEFLNFMDPATGKLNAGYELMSSGSLLPDIESQLAGINMDERGLNAVRDLALRSGPSQWANLLKQKTESDAAAKRDVLDDELSNQAAGAWSQLAMRGGADAGSRERLLTEGMREGSKARQRLAQEVRSNLLGIDVQDESNRLNLLQGLPGMEIQALQPKFQKTEIFGRAKEADLNRDMNMNQFNIKNRMLGLEGQNQFNLGKYGESMKAWAANRQAEAQENSGK